MKLHITKFVLLSYSFIDIVSVAAAAAAAAAAAVAAVAAAAARSSLRFCASCWGALRKLKYYYH